MVRYFVLYCNLAPTLRFYKIILNGRGHVFCVCFDFSRPFFSLLLFHNPAVHNHNPKILEWKRVNITFLFFTDFFHVKPVKSSWPINQSNQLCHWLLGNGRLNPLHLTPSIWHSHPSFWRFHLWMIQNPLCWESNKAFSKQLFPPQINSKWKLISILLLLFGVALAHMYTIICIALHAPQFT